MTSSRVELIWNPIQPIPEYHTLEDTGLHQLEWEQVSLHREKKDYIDFLEFINVNYIKELKTVLKEWTVEF